MMDIRDRIGCFEEDAAALRRTFPVPSSPSCRERLIAHFESQDFSDLPEGTDEALLEWHRTRSLAEEQRLRQAEAPAWEAIPFALPLDALLEGRRAHEFPSGRDAADVLHALSQSAERWQPGGPPLLSHQCSRVLKELKAGLEKWMAFFQPYDPEIAWWTKAPAESLLKAIDAASDRLPKTDEIPGEPLGREALERQLELELIPYGPEALIAAAEREFAWCTEEILKAARDLGLGSEQEALEHVKGGALPPGQQIVMARDMTREAIELVEELDLATVPDLAKETWRMEMLTPEQQKVSPFFLGGETLFVSYPTDAMDHGWKLMSMRGNAPGYSRATVQHEIIPGHHLQFYMVRRSRPYRQAFETPFWTEGWTLHWEMLWWELGFPRTPEERIGMMFWRRHRAGRVVFSLKYHLGEMTSSECVDYLEQAVGHERSTAEGEVRRSLAGDYPPLYQAAYLVGGWQVHRLYQEMRAAGWSAREFHDRFLQENFMPISVLRSVMKGEPLARPLAPTWRFLDE